MNPRFSSRVCVAIFASAVAVPAVVAQDYPNKPIRILIPSNPGGGTDILGRLLKEGFSELWGQPIVVDNRGGASGRIAAAQAAKATPDGYTLMFTYGGVLTTGLPLFKKLPYDPVRDFTPIAPLCHVPGVLVANPSFPAKSVGELIKLAKSTPGGLTHGTSSIGSSSHLNMELFKQMAGIDMHRVSYNGDGPAIVALLGGHVPFAFNNVVATMPHLRAGKLRALGVATSQRVPNLPDVPTIAESGLPGYEGLLFYGLVGPAGIPQPLVAKLHDAVQKSKQMPVVKQQLARLGGVQFDMSPQEFSGFLRRELEKWTQVIEKGNISAQ